MVRTHQKSRFVLKSLDEIRDCREVILQTEQTRSVFENNKTAYLCEVVSADIYSQTQSLEDLSSELLKAVSENRNLRRKIEKLIKEGGQA